MENRKYTWSFAELVDRLSIVIQKIVYSETPEMANGFAKERDDIVHDLNLFLKEGVKLDGEMIYKICALQLINATVWSNESAGRGDGDQKNYELTHSLNSDRASIKKSISEQAKGRIDFKLNYGKGTWDFKL